jgi:hypothetical protein
MIKRVVVAGNAKASVDAAVDAHAGAAGWVVLGDAAR